MVLKVYLVLEYIDGGELFDFIIKRGHLSEQVWFDCIRANV